MELGSEYNLSFSELNIAKDNFFSYLSGYNCVFTDSGRSALKMVTQSIRNVLLPEFICESVINCFNKGKVRFYKITESGEIDFDDLLSKIDGDTEAIFIMHYFGVLQPKPILEEIKKVSCQNSIIVIEDTTQSVFSAKSTVGDYMITSVRKWMPIPLGGVVYSMKELPTAARFVKSCDNARVYGMALKELYLRGVLDCNITYRDIFRKCEEDLERKENIELLSDVSRFIISCINIKHLRDIRKANYNYLLERLDRIGITPICKLKEDEVPFAFPIRVPDRDGFRRYLMDNKVYCAVHWPIDNYQTDVRKMAVRNAETLISLPIDQRYGKEEMDYLLDVIMRYGGEISF